MVRKGRTSISPLALLAILTEGFPRCGQQSAVLLGSSPLSGRLGPRPIYNAAFFPRDLGLTALLGLWSLSQAGLAGRWPLGAEEPPTHLGILPWLWAQNGGNLAARIAVTSTNL